MKNNKAFLRLDNLSNTVARIISYPEQKKKKVKKTKPFLIINTDNNYGFYAQQLLREIKKLPLLQQSSYNSKKLNKIRTSDIIVFGDSNKFDFRVETNINKFEDFEDTNAKVYDLVKDFNSIIERIEEYAYANYNEDYDDDNSFVFELPKFKSRKKVQKKNTLSSLLRKNTTNRKGNYSYFNKLRKKYYENEAEEIIINVKVTEEEEERPILKRYAKNRVVCIPDCDEKITVHENWVKIGYHQYDIVLDKFDNEYIELEDGTQLSVVEDRFGRRSLKA